ncbi:MAG TPA: hypothetical protein VI854_05445 [Acidimicrobiia bacterium]|nr:hypothetical protein [Acidimicrobiia bacterium]
MLDERARHELYLRLEATIGTEAATTLMELLPPVGWADVATKRDLDGLEERMNLRLDGLEERFDLKLDGLEHAVSHTFQRELRGAITSQTRTVALTLVGTNAHDVGARLRRRIRDGLTPAP